MSGSAQGSIIVPGVTMEKFSNWRRSVVVKDIPDNVVAVGNPCRVRVKSENMIMNSFIKMKRLTGKICRTMIKLTKKVKRL